MSIKYHCFHSEKLTATMVRMLEWEIRLSKTGSDKQLHDSAATCLL